MDLIKNDNIYSGLLGENIAEIQISKNFDADYYYNGTIIKLNFPEKLILLIQEYWDCVDDFSLALLDDIEEEIMSYQLKLAKNSIKIFRLEFEKNFELVTFSTKYPTVKGFMDDYPI